MTEPEQQTPETPVTVTWLSKLFQALSGFVLAIHRRLLPNRREIGWIPYLWLFYLSLPVWSWIIRPASTTVLLFGILSLILFLGIYFNAYWRRGRAVFWNIGALAVLGLVWSPFNSAAIVFYISAPGLAGAAGPPRIGRRVLAAIAVVIVLATLLLDHPPLRGLLTLCLCGVVGATNIYFAELSRKGDALRRSQEEVERLATIAERERIARDLHDLLGHTLSVITLKAELARKLSERGDERAATEIADVERISRDALRQVREAVEGYREAGLAGELARARLVCDAREITLDTDVAPVDLETRQEAALAMVLREAVTNIARHARATHCRIALSREPSEIVLSIHNNGRPARFLPGHTRFLPGPSRALPATEPSGHGLIFMRERMSELGGRLLVDNTEGWLLEARLPAHKRERNAESAVEDPAEPLPASLELAAGEAAS